MAVDNAKHLMKSLTDDYVIFNHLWCHFFCILGKDCSLSSDRILAMCKLLCGFACPFLGSIKFNPVFP